MDFIDTQRTAMADLAPQYTALGEQFQRKLWHQLTDTLETFVNDPAANKGDNLIQLYERFIASFEARVNQLRLVTIVAQIATQYCPSRPYNVAELDRAIGLMSSLKEKRARLGEEAYVTALMETVSFQLKRATALPSKADSEAELDRLKGEIDTGKSLLDGLTEANPIASASVFRVAAEYYKLRGPAAQFYHYALQYLAHRNVDLLTEAERQVLATDVAIAALVGDKVFNFGEIVAHPLMTSLAGTPHEWLAELLRVFHTGDIDGFNSIVAAHREEYEKQPALMAAQDTVKEKVAIVCVMELASQRPATDRSVSFADLAAATRLPTDHVEWLLMRAMSMGLIEGVMDEVDQVIHISFIKPRVMDMAQIEALRVKMQAWSEKVKSTLLYIEDRTRELFA